MPVYYSSPYLLPISWGIFIGALIWRGKIRAAWCKQGYDYDTFRLVARMKGSPVRVKLLNLLGSSKNRLQLANELQVDWRTIDNHIQSLTRISLIEETVSVGTTKYYHLTEHGRRVLSLLEENKESFESPDSISSNPPSSQENIGS
jgi:DNA-binding MarR family transcriptional regulator